MRIEEYEELNWCEKVFVNKHGLHLYVCVRLVSIIHIQQNKTTIRMLKHMIVHGLIGLVYFNLTFRKYEPFALLEKK